MSTTVILRVNKTNTDSAYASAPSNYQEVESGDSLIFSKGSAAVADGQPIPTSLDLIKAASLLDPTIASIVAHYFLADISANLLREIALAGNQSKRYAFCASFDGATATEPQLEAWDDSTMASYALGCLGGGTPALSWYRAVCTTLAAHNPNTEGTPLAGDGVGNVVLLNNNSGALTGAADLYFNFCVKIPAAYSTPGQYLQVLVITFITN